MVCHIAHDHWCDTHRPTTGLGMGPGFFCPAAHPGHTEQHEILNAEGRREIVTVATVHCRRPKGHDGHHAAFVFSISTPETWPNYRDEEPPF
jgi:hypothetical protein